MAPASVTPPRGGGRSGSATANHADPVGIRAGRFVAGRLLCSLGAVAIGLTWVTAMIGASGCLVTDEIVEKVDPPPESKPHPPSIVESSVSPTNGVCLKPLGDVVCEKMTFSIGTIVDTGTGDDHQLMAKWFLDYEPGSSFPNQFNAGGIIATEPNAQGERVCSSKQCSLDFDPNDLRFARGIHILKIMISDGFDNTDPKLPDKVKQGSGLATYTWCVDTSHCVGGGR